MSFRWKIYFFVFAPLVIANAFSLFAENSTIGAYYRILMIFHSGYTLPYIFNCYSTVITALSAIPLYLFVFKMRWLNPRIWQWLLAIRLIFDIVGHSYEVKLFESIFRTDVLLGASMLFLTLLFIMPSYIANFLYAFKQEKIFG